MRSACYVNIVGLLTCVGEGYPCKRHTLNAIDFTAAFLAAGVPLPFLSPPDFDETNLYASLLAAKYNDRSGMEWLLKSLSAVLDIMTSESEEAQGSCCASETSLELRNESDRLLIALLHMTCACRSHSDILIGCEVSGTATLPSWYSCRIWSLPPYEGVVAGVTLQRIVLTCAHAHLQVLLSLKGVESAESDRACHSSLSLVDMMHGVGFDSASTCSNCQQRCSSMYICSNITMICLFLIDAIEDAVMLPTRGVSDTYAMLGPLLALEALSRMLEILMDWLHTAVHMIITKNKTKIVSQEAVGVLVHLQKHLLHRHVLVHALKQYDCLETIEAFQNLNFQMHEWSTATM